MSWMSNWLGRLLGKSTDNAPLDEIVRRVEPAIWTAIDGRIPMVSAHEVRGYVWARAGHPVRQALADLSLSLSPRHRQQLIEQSRHAVADRVVEQLEIFSAEPLRRAA